MERLLVQAHPLNTSKKFHSNKSGLHSFCLSHFNRITSYVLSDSYGLYLRLAPVVIGKYICRSRPALTSTSSNEVKLIETSITLASPS